MIQLNLGYGDYSAPAGRAIDIEEIERETLGIGRAQKILVYEQVKQALVARSKGEDIRNIEVPDYLLCRITDELMEEPVCLESGFTYEKE